MTMNIGGFGYGNQMMGGMSAMGMSGGNQFQYFKEKYGCEDCFRSQPYDYECPKPRLYQPKSFVAPSFWQRILSRISGG